MRDRDHAAERQPADMRAVDAELAHRREDRGGIIVARRALGRRVAVAIAGIIERDGAALVPKWSSCGRHTDLSEPTPWRKTIGVASPLPASS